MKKIIYLSLFALLLAGCSSNKKEKTELEKILDEKNYIIVDVRTKEEYLESHLVDAINIPYDEIDSTINLDKKKTILVYCKSGRRSGIAKQNLISLGYEVYDMGAYQKIDLPKE